MSARFLVPVLAAVMAAAALAPGGAFANPAIRPAVAGMAVKPKPILGVVIPPKPITGIVIHPPHPIWWGGGAYPHPYPVVWWHHHHEPWLIGEGSTTHAISSAPAVSSGPGSSGLGPCTCLTKQYLGDGSVMFQDICTKEAAVAPPGQFGAQAHGATQ